MENKQEILNSLLDTLVQTRDAGDLISLDYDEQKEIVTAEFVCGKRFINVNMDSGIAMIRDVVTHLGL